MQALSGIGSWFGNNASTVIPGALSGAGFLSNWLNGRRQRQREDFLQGLAQDPAKMNAYVKGFYKPLQQGLVANVGNKVQGYLGERGLSESPNISADVMAQSIAPYEQQQQQSAFADAMASLGLMPTGSPQANLSSPLSLLMKGLQKTPTASTGDTPMGLVLPSGGGPFDLDTLLGTQAFGGGA